MRGDNTPNPDIIRNPTHTSVTAMRIPSFSTAHVVPALVGLCSLLVVAASGQSQVSRADQPRCGTPPDCQKTANAAFEAEAARAGKDCPGASNQYAENICLSEAADKTERNIATSLTFRVRVPAAPYQPPPYVSASR